MWFRRAVLYSTCAQIQLSKLYVVCTNAVPCVRISPINAKLVLPSFGRNLASKMKIGLWQLISVMKRHHWKSDFMVLLVIFWIFVFILFGFLRFAFPNHRSHLFLDMYGAIGLPFFFFQFSPVLTLCSNSVCYLYVFKTWVIFQKSEIVLFF